MNPSIKYLIALFIGLFILIQTILPGEPVNTVYGASGNSNAIAVSSAMKSALAGQGQQVISCDIRPNGSGVSSITIKTVPAKTFIYNNNTYFYGNSPRAIEQNGR